MWNDRDKTKLEKGKEDNAKRFYRIDWILRSKNVKILSKEIYEYNTFVSSRQRIEICQRKNSKISWNEATEQTCVTFRSNNYVSHNINDIYSSSPCSKMMEMVWKLSRDWNYLRTITLPLLFYFLPFQSRVARCIRDTKDERIHVERRAVVKKLYFVFERRPFETTRVSTTDVCTCLKTFKWLFKYEAPYVYLLKYSCMERRVNLTGSKTFKLVLNLKKESGNRFK